MQKHAFSVRPINDVKVGVNLNREYEERKIIPDTRAHKKLIVSLFTLLSISSARGIGEAYPWGYSGFKTMLPDVLNASESSHAGIYEDIRRGIVVIPMSIDELNTILKNESKELKFVKEPIYTTTLVDGNHRLSPSDKPEDLVSISSCEGIPYVKAAAISKSIGDPLKRLFNFVNKQKSNRLLFASGNRSYNVQKTLFQDKVRRVFATHPELDRNNKADMEEAERIAELSVAREGTSEHQLYAVDLTTKSMLDEYYRNQGNVVLAEKFHYLRAFFEETPEGKLVVENAYKYGFDISFKKGKEHITGHEYEPWHLYYRGIHAEILHKNSWVMQEYVDFMKNHKSILFMSETGKQYWITYDSESRRMKAYEITQKGGL